ncbi:MAG: glucosamine-6-phosphate deaminase [Phycisphaeraceae bacterium]|nr:glucosamine-6-phosphate deaminase [Phycisphaeraceae bacterium]
MKIEIRKDKKTLGEVAASDGAKLIRNAILERGRARVILATGASQFEMLAALLKQDVDWKKVTGFHLDEYVGLAMTHPASFRKYLKERFVDQASPAAFHYLNAERDPKAECRRVGALLAAELIDVAFVGIGENGHLAFNDPPADFVTTEPYLVVELDERCQQQQVGEGWFATLADVPKQAISMSCRQILKARAIVCTVPDRRKAEAVKNTVEGPVSPRVPASILQEHGQTTLYLDEAAASLLKKK